MKQRLTRDSSYIKGVPSTPTSSGVRIANTIVIMSSFWSVVVASSSSFSRNPNHRRQLLQQTATSSGSVTSSTSSWGALGFVSSSAISLTMKSTFTTSTPRSRNIIDNSGRLFAAPRAKVQQHRSKNGVMTMWGEDNSEAKKPNIPRSFENDDGRSSDRSRGSRGNSGGDVMQDDEGRRVRRSGGGNGGGKPSSSFGWEDDIDSGGDRQERSTKRNSNDWDDSFDAGNGGDSSGGGWDDYVPAAGNTGETGLDPYEFSYTSPTTKRRDSDSRSGGRGRGRGRNREGGRGRGRGDRDGGRGDRRGDRGGGRGGGRGRGRGDKRAELEQAAERKINMRALEGAGFDHLYGIAPVLNALTANTRDFADPGKALADRMDIIDQETIVEEEKQQARKPEAQFAPWLFLQEDSGGGGGSKRSHSKAMAGRSIERLATEMGIPVARVDKGVLNALSGMRPHQGFILRCGSLQFPSIDEQGLPNPAVAATAAPNLWLALDEIVDPQNLGALLRSAYFIGGDRGQQQHARIGVIVTSRNSSPPTPIVSAASAGALELMMSSRQHGNDYADANSSTSSPLVYSTGNMSRLLNTAKEEGWRVLGAAAESPNDSNDEHQQQCFDLQNISGNTPTILVLGSEGSGLRRLVAKACTDFVRIPGGVTTGPAAGVDSLNVSVTGGILLWHLAQNQNTNDVST